MSETRYIFEAVESIRLAKSSEQQLEYASAAKLYDTAIHLFITGVQSDSNKQRQDLVRKKLEKCLQRADRCRKNAIKPQQQQQPTEKVQLSKSNSVSTTSSKSAIVWPSDLHAYHLTQVVTADIWLVSCIEDKPESPNTVEGLMLGIPRIKPATNTQDLMDTLEQSKSVLSQQDYLFAQAISQSIARKYDKKNSKKSFNSTAQRFLKKYQTAVENEIRTEDTIFLLLEATTERLDFAKNIRHITSQNSHSTCQTESSCQACRLRASQRRLSFETNSKKQAEKMEKIIADTNNIELSLTNEQLEQIDSQSSAGVSSEVCSEDVSKENIELTRNVSSPATSGIESSPLSSRSASLEKRVDNIPSSTSQLHLQG